MNMKVKKISMSGLLCLTTALMGFAFVGNASADTPEPWKQTEFMIGAYDGVRMSGDPSQDKKSLETVIDAGFNLIVKQEPYTSSFHLTGEDYEGRTVSSIKYCLERVADINNTYGANTLKMIANDYRFFASIH